MKTPLDVSVVFGTRPEAIKMAPIIEAMRPHADRLRCRVIVTAQHRDMLDQVLGLFGIRPEIDLDLMRPDQSLPDLSTAVIRGLSETFTSSRPGLVLVQGDTTSTFLAALAAFYQKIPVGHVEAGLRTFDKFQPYPEEINRRLTTDLADLHFAPTQKARENLLADGVREEAIRVTGNTSIDALFSALAKRKELGRFPQLDIDPEKRLILVTAHRRENFGRPIRDICAALERISDKYPNVVILYPVHPNPNIRKPVYELLSGHPSIMLTEPMDYLPFTMAMERAELVLTDSGGLQEEAPALGKPVLVLREVTERIEAVEAGTVRLVGMNPDRIVEEASRLLDDPAAYGDMATRRNPYGDGTAGRRIVESILQWSESRQG